jgi:hypothetical protein
VLYNSAGDGEQGREMRTLIQVRLIIRINSEKRLVFLFRLDISRINSDKILVFLFRLDLSSGLTQKRD